MLTAEFWTPSRIAGGVLVLGTLIPMIPSLGVLFFGKITAAEASFRGLEAAVGHTTSYRIITAGVAPWAFASLGGNRRHRNAASTRNGAGTPVRRPARDDRRLRRDMPVGFGGHRDYARPLESQSGPAYRVPDLMPMLPNSPRKGGACWSRSAVIRRIRWWSWGDSNPLRLVCQTSALPIELQPRGNPPPV